MSERLDRISYSRKVKNKFSNFIGENSTDIIAIERIVKFANKHFIMLSTSLEEYERKEIKKSRVLWANAYRLCCLVSALRFFMSSVFSNETMITIMCDGNYMVSNQRILSMILSLACFIILFICVLLQFNEMNYKWYLLTFLYQLEHRQLIPLNTKNKRKLAIIINLMVKLLMKQAFWPLVTFASLLFCGPPLVAYFDNKYNFSIILVIFFTICIIVWSLQYFCIVCAGFVAWTVPFFYLKFKFNEIYETVEFCVKHNNIDVLKRVISQHNRLDKTNRRCLHVCRIHSVLRGKSGTNAYAIPESCERILLFVASDIHIHCIDCLFRCTLSESVLRSNQSFSRKAEKIYV